jgi:hypothetical protein
MRKIINFIKIYWREIVVLIMYLSIQSKVNSAITNSERAYDYAADASSYARQAMDYASEASDNASDAANSASYCEYLN